MRNRVAGTEGSNFYDPILALNILCPDRTSEIYLEFGCRFLLKIHHNRPKSRAQTFGRSVQARIMLMHPLFLMPRLALVQPSIPLTFYDIYTVHNGAN